MAITHEQTDDDEREQRARRARVARVWAGFTRSELAAALGVSFQTVERSETCRRRLEVDELVLIGDVCRVPEPFMRYGWPACCADSEYLEELFERLDELGREVQRLGRGASPPR